MKTLIQTPTNNLENSIDFYSKLNFEPISKESPTIFSGGDFLIEINPSRFSRAGLKLFQTDWKSEIKQLEQLIPVLKTDSGYLINDNNGVWIELIEKEYSGFTASKEGELHLGNFAGLSIETISMHKSQEFYSILGFESTSGNPDQGWLTMTNKDKFSISFMAPNMCPHLFFTPSFTFFNGKEGNPKVIQKVRELNIEIAEEITHFNKEGIVDNIIIRDPGGTGFFLFND